MYKNKYYNMFILKRAVSLTNSLVVPAYLPRKPSKLFRLKRMWLKLTGRFTGHIVVNTKG